MDVKAKSIEDINALAEDNDETKMTKEKIKDGGKSKDIDYLLENIVGGGGWGQWLILIAQYPIAMVSGLPLLIQMFAAYEPRHRCFVPNCDGFLNGSNNIQTSWVPYSLPKDYGSSEMFRADESFDPCKMYEIVNQTECSASSFDNSSIIKCDKFVYDHSEFTETLTTKLDLVCDDEYKRRLLGTLMMLGLLIGSLAGGRLSDRFGRKLSMFGATVVLTPVVMFAGYSPNYATYAVLRFMSAACLPVIWVTGHSLTLEVFEKEYRKSVVIVKDFIGPVAQLILVFIIYFVRHWKYIHLWTGVVCLLAFPCFFFIPESVRWLAINGKIKQAERILLTIARRNGKSISEYQREEIRNTLVHIEKDAHKTKGQENLNPLDMVNTCANLTKTLILLFNWVTVCVGAYTLMLNATKLYGDLFLNYIMVVLLGEIPGTIALLITLKYFGRRFNLFYTQLILGVCCIILAFLPKSYNAAITTFYLIGKCFAGAAFLMVWLITAELYPTNLRGQAIGSCSAVARVFGLVAPFVARLAVYWKPLPMLILGVPSIFAACLVYFMPETKHIELPTMMKDADELVNMNKETKSFLKKPAEPIEKTYMKGLFEGFIE